MNFRDKISRWMIGRYGFDKFTYALFLVYGVLVISNLFVKSDIIYGASLLVIAYIFFRMISKNTHKRQVENNVFNRLLNPILADFKLEKRRIKEMKTHRFRKCKKCKTVLRLRKKTGVHTVECPRCHLEQTVKIWM
ncbi:MAG: hypothetical protein H7X94_13945 [Vallitaleaceae bacterium]|nr:hypothetical protein [Vallitaleaceae bacterium]